jgi:hypothetical protein
VPRPLLVQSGPLEIVALLGSVISLLGLLVAAELLAVTDQTMQPTTASLWLPPRT